MSSLNLNSEAKSNLQKLAADFRFRLRNMMKIRDADGKFSPFVLNKAQEFVHEQLEAQRKEKGFVRALILKGRQQGMSTYISARFFDMIMLSSGLKAFILAHREDATSNLYSLVDRFYENYPAPFRSSIKESNAKRLFFQNGSGYGVGTAGGGSIGRSDTIQLLHMSEAAFYENTKELISGIMQTVPDRPNTEIILESTANGMGNMFHKMCTNADNMNGPVEEKNGYILIFVPWFWEERYVAKVPDNFNLTEDEAAYKDTYQLTNEQMMWRRHKIAATDKATFRQEYPATIDEAFESTQEEKIISMVDVNEARKSGIEVDPNAGLIIGVDPAHEGKDRTVISFRRARVQYKSEVYKGWKTPEIVGRIIQIIKEFKPLKIFIDKGYNPGIYDRLVELGWGDIVVPVHFGGTADDPARFYNKRAEMWYRMSKWFEDKPVRIEDDTEMQAELTCVGREPPDSLGRLIIQKKEKIRKDTGRSPDKADALALTFAFMVATYEDVDVRLDQYYVEDNLSVEMGKNSVTGY